MLLRALDSHTDEVSGVVYGKGKTLISSGWDSRIIIHNELLPHTKTSIMRGVHWYAFLKCENIHFLWSNNQDVTNLASSVNLGLFAACDSSNTVRIWDFDTCFVESQLKFDNELTAIHMVECYPVLFVGDCLGFIYLYSLRPIMFKNQLLMKYESSHSV